ncbi:hypothetical protein, partial [Aquabacterium sp.]|uniref:hypothetical protein n=1 Tax=Aquabacterium sp. TaxID=1872578 RepID=UPI0025B9FC33
MLQFIQHLLANDGIISPERDRARMQVLEQIKDILEHNKYRRMSEERFREYDAILERLLVAAKQETARTRRRTRSMSGYQGIMARPHALKPLDITLNHRSFGYRTRGDSIINSRYKEPFPRYFPSFLKFLDDDDGRNGYRIVIPKGTRMYHGFWAINPRDYMKNDRLFVGLYPAISMAILTETLAFY